MEAVQAKNHTDMVNKLVKDFGGKGEFAEGLKKEGMNDWTKTPTEKAISDIFEAGIINYYPEGSKSIIVQNASNGKNNNWNFVCRFM